LIGLHGVAGGVDRRAAKTLVSNLPQEQALAEINHEDHLAIIKPFKLDEVRDALTAAGCTE
jgi:hypothetical protein